MCEVRIYLYRVLYALAMDWSPLNFEIPAIMESYGMAWYLLYCYIMLIILCFRILSLLGSFQIIHEVIEIMFKV